MGLRQQPGAAGGRWLLLQDLKEWPPRGAAGGKPPQPGWALRRWPRHERRGPSPYQPRTNLKRLKPVTR